MSDPTALAKAIAMLRAGRPVRITGAGELSFGAVETTTQELLDLRDPDHCAKLILSGERAATLRLANERNAADPAAPAMVVRAPWVDEAAALSIADPARDFEREPTSPLQTTATKCPELAAAALDLARSAGLLPALWAFDPDPADFALPIHEIADSARNAAVTRIARARLPIEGLPPTQIVAFRAGDTGNEQVALLVGAFAGKPPLVRLHSECLTGDVFGSLKCDCGPQLHEALRIIAEEGGGILLYLRQEGRGIGLANKIRAYSLQDRGLDTVEANRRLGFADDERDYAHAASMLRQLGAQRVRLLTNNPAKVEGLQAAGIAVVERVPHQMPANPHNADYLSTKRKKSGHLLV